MFNPYLRYFGDPADSFEFHPMHARFARAALLDKNSSRIVDKDPILTCARLPCSGKDGVCVVWLCLVCDVRQVACVRKMGPNQELCSKLENDQYCKILEDNHRGCSSNGRAHA